MKNVLLGLARLLIGLIFLLSGLVKINDLTGFIYKLEEYFYVFDQQVLVGFRWFVPYALHFSVVLTLLETTLAFMIVAGIWRTFTTSMLLALILFFTILTGYSAVTGSVTDCGCFGDAIKLTPWHSFYKDVVLAVVILFLFLNRAHLQPLVHSKGGKFIYVFVSTAVCTFLLWYCFNYLPLIDFRPYKTGTDLKLTTTTRAEDGHFIAKDYQLFLEACGQNELEGITLLIVMYDMDKVKPEQLQQTVLLAKQLSAETKIKVLAGTSTGSDRRKEIVAQYGLPYCVAPQDLNMLKTMIRSNPGYILLKDGVVKAMWPATRPPSLASIFSKLEN